MGHNERGRPVSDTLGDRDAALSGGPADLWFRKAGCGAVRTLSRTRRSAVCLVATAALVAGCTTGGSDSDATASAGPYTLTVAHDQEFDAYNNSTSSTNTTSNQLVLNQVLPSFWEYGPDGEVRPLDSFGSYEKTSDSPLTVRYRINPEAVWSDGEPIDCDDVKLLWAARSEAFPQAGFQPASTSGYVLQESPQCADGERDFTLVYKEPYADWQAGFGGDGGLLPAHIVEQQAQVPDLVAAVDGGDVAALTRAAEFWNRGWSFEPGALDPALTPSSGPYKLDSWRAGQSLTLVANDRYWGDPPHAERIVFRFLPQSEQVTALRNNEIQVIAPQANEDVLALLQEGPGTAVEVGDEFTVEQLTFNFRGVMADPQVRRAFALCVPRDEIVDKLVKPLNPDAVVMQSRFVFPFQPGYRELADAVTDGGYDRAAVAEARRLLKSAGAEGTRVRIGYQTPNARRADTVAIIRASCEQAGFVIDDNSDENYYRGGGKLETGAFDVALFGWSGSPLVSGNTDLYHSVPAGQTATLNKGHYANPQVDAWLTTLETTTDPDRQRQLLTDVDRQMWQDLATLPLYAHPGVTAHRSQVDGVTFQPSLSGVTWNAQEWRRHQP